MWASETFSDYALGLRFVLETGHKPLTALLNSTELSKMPPRILRFCVRLMRFAYHVPYVPGKHQGAANALSRAPASTPERVVCRASRSIYNSGNSQSTCHSHKTTRNLRGTEGGWRMQPSTSSLLAWVAWLRLISHSFTHTGKEEATSLFYTTYSCMMTA